LGLGGEDRRNGLPNLVCMLQTKNICLNFRR
jgi:hypothetical protein